MRSLVHRIETLSVEPRGRWQHLLVLTLLLLPASWPQSVGMKGGDRTMFGIRSASAGYLEDAGKLSYMLNELIDQLLEKISFLADMVIESSMDEHCMPVSCQPETTIKPTQSAATSEPSRHRRESDPIGFTSGSSSGTTASPNLGPKLDELEYDNSERYKRQFAARMQAQNSGEPQTSDAYCKLFNMAVGKQDLPVEDMEICCARYNGCYSLCGNSKLDCDIEFRSCLTQVCRQKFDYTNATVIKRNLRSLKAYEEDEEQEDDDDDDDDDVGIDNRVEEPDNDNEAFEPFDVTPDSGNDEFQSGSKRRRSAKTPSAEQISQRDSRRLKDKYKACKLANKVLIIGNLAFGCQAFKKAQWTACCSQSSSNNTNTSNNNNFDSKAGFS